MAKISGILTDGAGQIINNCTIELCAKTTTNRVLIKTQAFIVADDGKYEINAVPCEYDVTLIINGFPPKKLGAIQIFSDSVDGTLNDFLLNPTEDEVTPAILQQVFEARNETNKSANRAIESENRIKISENNAVEASNSAKKSADGAKSSAVEASKTATSVRSSVDDAKKSAELSAAEANNAKNSADNAKKSADLANQLATSAKNSAQQSADSAAVAQQSANLAKNSAGDAAQSAVDAKNAALSIDVSNFIQSNGIDSQYISGSLNVNQLSEGGARVYSPNNKPSGDDIGALPAIKSTENNIPIYRVGGHVVFTDIIGDQRLMPFRRNELPFGWYFRNGDNFLLSSPQGQALNRLSTNYKNDHRITIKTINGQQYINVPTAFASDGRGCFERPVDGAARQVGHIEGDTIRNINARFGNFLTSARDASGAFRVESTASPAYDGNGHGWHTTISFDASRVVPTANENRPINIGMTPVIYLGV